MQSFCLAASNALSADILELFSNEMSDQIIRTKEHYSVMLD